MLRCFRALVAVSATFGPGKWTKEKRSKILAELSFGWNRKKNCCCLYCTLLLQLIFRLPLINVKFLGILTHVYTAAGSPTAADAWLAVCRPHPAAKRCFSGCFRFISFRRNLLIANKLQTKSFSSTLSCLPLGGWQSINSTTNPDDKYQKHQSKRMGKVWLWHTAQFNCKWCRASDTMHSMCRHYLGCADELANAEKVCVGKAFTPITGVNYFPFEMLIYPKLNNLCICQAGQRRAYCVLVHALVSVALDWANAADNLDEKLLARISAIDECGRAEFRNLIATMILLDNANLCTAH